MIPPLPLADAQARLLALVPALAAEIVPTAEAHGRILAQPLIARRTQPPADLSAMDGYALCDGTSGPWHIVGESAAGHPYAGTLSRGEAVRISTGSIVPQGATTILLQEDAQREGETLHAMAAPLAEGRHIRRVGFDFCHGDTLLAEGCRMIPARLALALSGGHGRIGVIRKPHVVIFDSGDELAADPEHCQPHQIPASNGAMLAALAASLPCSLSRSGPVPDDRAALQAALEHAGDADLIVTTGGASVGDHDLIRPALEQWGADIDFWRVAIKPGKPLLVARRGRQIILGLPGNPVSGFVTAYLFMLPLIRALSGAVDVLPREMTARLGTALPDTGKRMEFVRAFWDGEQIRPVQDQDSSALAALSASNALIIRPANAHAIETGTYVPFYWLENGGIT